MQHRLHTRSQLRSKRLFLYAFDNYLIQCFLGHCCHRQTSGIASCSSSPRYRNPEVCEAVACHARRKVRIVVRGTSKVQAVVIRCKATLEILLRDRTRSTGQIRRFYCQIDLHISRVLYCHPVCAFFDERCISRYRTIFPGINSAEIDRRSIY